MLQATVWWDWLHLEYVYMYSVIIVNDGKRKKKKNLGVKCLHDIVKSCLHSDYFDFNYGLVLFLLPLCCYSLHPKQNVLFKICFYLPQMQNPVLRQIWYIFRRARDDLLIVVILFICSISRCDHTIIMWTCGKITVFFFFLLKIGSYYALLSYTDMFVGFRVLRIPFFVRDTTKKCLHCCVSDH